MTREEIESKLKQLKDTGRLANLHVYLNGFLFLTTYDSRELVTRYGICDDVDICCFIFGNGGVYLDVKFEDFEEIDVYGQYIKIALGKQKGKENE